MFVVGRIQQLTPKIVLNFDALLRPLDSYAGLCCATIDEMSNGDTIAKVQIRSSKDCACFKTSSGTTSTSTGTTTGISAEKEKARGIQWDRVEPIKMRFETVENAKGFVQEQYPNLKLKRTKKVGGKSESPKILLYTATNALLSIMNV